MAPLILTLALVVSAACARGEDGPSSVERPAFLELEGDINLGNFGVRGGSFFGMGIGIGAGFRKGLGSGFESQVVQVEARGYTDGVIIPTGSSGVVAASVVIGEFSVRSGVGYRWEDSPRTEDRGARGVYLAMDAGGYMSSAKRGASTGTNGPQDPFFDVAPRGVITQTLAYYFGRSGGVSERYEGQVFVRNAFYFGPDLPQWSIVLGIKGMLMVGRFGF